MPQPRVAVVTPVYNGAAYLAETLDCVQAQTYENLVHVLLDNASTDDTPKIIDRYEGGRVPIIRHKNAELLPLAENWNAAVSKTPAEADYFRLICADDKMTPDCIARMVALAEMDPKIIAVGVGVHEGDTPLDFSWPAGEAITDGDDIARRFFEARIGFYATHMLMRRRALDLRSDLFDASFGTGIDFEAVLMVLKHGRFGSIEEKLGWVRVHENTITNTVMKKQNAHFIAWLKALATHGPDVFTEADYDRVKRRYKRYYGRQMLRWRRAGGAEAVDAHIAAWSEVDDAFSPLDFAASLAEEALVRTGLKQPWTGWPN